MAERKWRSTEVLAWTEREGLGRQPAGPPRLLLAGMAGTLGVVFAGMLLTDALCPEHRALVQAIGGLALVGSVVAMVGLLRQSPAAPLVAMLTAVSGVAIGFVDAVHDPARGTLIALAFGGVALGACAIAWRQLRLARWERSALSGLHDVDPPASTTGVPVRTELPTAR
jgi:hypothetical protein